MDCFFKYKCSFLSRQCIPRSTCSTTCIFGISITFVIKCEILFLNASRKEKYVPYLFLYLHRILKKSRLWDDNITFKWKILINIKKHPILLFFSGYIKIFLYNQTSQVIRRNIMRDYCKITTNDIKRHL